MTYTCDLSSVCELAQGQGPGHGGQELHPPVLAAL